MQWNVIFRDLKTGRLKPFNVFEDASFRLAVEQLIAKKYYDSPFSWNRRN